ncbi:hypothetical protein [Ligilactobacillus equi]
MERIKAAIKKLNKEIEEISEVYYGEDYMDGDYFNLYQKIVEEQRAIIGFLISELEGKD